ncbi:hypothetical protein [Devosia sediminis]|uniref:Uncharacterized protein n=1 Tax=Devosia sediminis TaxID=2798801 RepID=A0A934MSV2_9HYPH|nr:hypothetical protein [Devosia sediminis]MBJ3786814.1 hypothetical protein [Devosia sediminis]
MRENDLILEGATDRDVAALRALARGGAGPAPGDIAPLLAKGWVDVIGKDTIITLTGRTLIEGRT